ncbi:hypothetical protein BHE74_00029241 [Ensete ventricosum]|nr:hypothetical protein GW17_00058632 [Ensete ventricosum]RWW63567.1 hypothetical protein BHE74_00029241 [Ensete ventricosum]RZS03159.1 hypothetical protein BHM03_00033299 [Ensete ventricosum]
MRSHTAGWRLVLGSCRNHGPSILHPCRPSFVVSIKKGVSSSSERVSPAGAAVTTLSTTAILFGHLGVVKL